MNTNENSGINSANEIAATAAANVNSLEERRRKADKIKAGAIGTAKAVGYMAVGAAVTIGVQKMQAKRQASAAAQ